MLRLFRFELPFSAGVCVVFGQILALGKLPAATDVALGFMSIFCISATALILNDCFDHAIDLVNAPERPLPSGQVKKGDVALLSIVVALLGFACSFMISLEALLVLFCLWVIGLLYNWRFKRTGLPGNLMVSFSVGMTFIFGGLSVGILFEKMVWFFAVLVMLIDLGEEIAADAMDMEGDALAGSRSLAIVWGQERALKISGAVFAAVVALSSVPFLLGWLRLIYLLPFFIMDVVIVYSVVKLLNPRTENRRGYIRAVYLGGLVAILIFILIRLAL